MKIEKLVPSKFPYEGSGDNLISAFNKINRNFDALGVKDVTYDQLVEMITYSRLIPFTYYRITDYRTVHYMVSGIDYSVYPFLNSSMIKDGEGNLVLNTGPIEPLIVFALSENVIHTEAYSEMYPKDIIYYDWDLENWRYDASIGALDQSIVPGFKGVIHYRINTLLNIQVPGDFRAVKTRRWKTSNPISGANNDYVLTTSTHEDVLDPEDYKDVYMFHDYRNDKCWDFSGKEVSNIIIKPNIEDSNYWYFPGTMLANNVFYVDSEYSWLYIYNIELGFSSSHNTFSGYCVSLKAGDFACYNIWVSRDHEEYGDFLIANIFSGSGYYNKYGADIFNCYFGDKVRYNDFSSVIHHSVFKGDNFYNKFNRGLMAVNIGSHSYHNEVGQLSWGFKIPDRTSATRTQKNKFTDNLKLMDDSVFVEFDVDDIDVDKKQFTITAHGLGDPGEFVVCRFNKVSGSNLDRHVENEIYVYKILDEDTLNIFTGGDGIAYIFRNKPATGVYKLTPVTTDFSAATHIYGDYDCEIFKRADGEFRLKYVDATDATVIVDPTA